MGLLDDAIREHLDLKRRRGADPTEVERSEREALGPVRRTPEHVPGDDFEHEPDGAPEAAFSPDETDAYEPAESNHPEGDSHPGEFGAAAPPGPEIEEDDSSWSYDEASAASELSTGPQEGVVPPPHPAGSTRLDEDADHTAEYDVAATLGSEPIAEPPLTEDELEETDTRGAPAHSDLHESDAALGEVEPGTPSGEDEDVLEETPEFLQDTPDHDRLWFEQRPPKDFDFDG